MKSKILNLVMVSTMFLITGCTDANANGLTDAVKEVAGKVLDKVVSFTDISGHWAKSSIEIAVKKGYVDGYPGGLFKPDKEVTRAEFIKMTVDALKLPKLESQSSDYWYIPYVKAGDTAGIVKIDDFNTGDWNTAISRQEMIRIAVRATEPDTRDANGMTNDPSFVYKATKIGLISGMGNGELALDGHTTRAQAVSVIERFLSINEGKTLGVDQDAESQAEVALHKTNMQTIFGLTSKTIPLKLDVGGSVNVELDRVLVVDLDRKDGAYRSWFPQLEKVNGQPIGSEYLIAMHFNIENTKVSDGYWTFRQKLGAMTPFSQVVETQNKTQINYLGTYSLKELFQKDGWYLMTAPKDRVKLAQDRKTFALTIASTDGELIFLNEK